MGAVELDDDGGGAVVVGDDGEAVGVEAAFVEDAAELGGRSDVVADPMVDVGARPSAGPRARM